MSAPRPAFRELIELRREWRMYHERQDRENADRVFRRAGIERLAEKELSVFPQTFRLKLNEFGRDWERILSVQGHQEGLAFFRLPLLVEVEEVTALNDWIERTLNQIGAALFFESAGTPALDHGIWDSVFYFGLPSTITPESIGFSKAPGIHQAGKAELIL